MKRGQAPVNYVMMMILAGLVILVSIVIIVALQNTFKQSEDDIDCTAGIASHAALVKYTGGKAAPAISPIALEDVRRIDALSEIERGIIGRPAEQ